jgi:hypothetical protein
MSESSKNPIIPKESEEKLYENQENSNNIVNETFTTSPNTNIQQNTDNLSIKNVLLNLHNNEFINNNYLSIKFSDESHNFIKKYSQPEKIKILNALSERIGNGIKMAKIKEIIAENNDEDKDFFVVEKIIHLNLLNHYPFVNKKTKRNNSKATNYQHCIACFILYDLDDVKYDCKNRSKNYLYNHFILCNIIEKSLFLNYRQIKREIKNVKLKLKNLQILKEEILEIYERIMKNENSPANEILQTIPEKINKINIRLRKFFELINNQIARLVILDEILHFFIGF